MLAFSFIANYCYFSFTTVPKAPQNLTIRDINTTGVIVSWMEPEDTSNGPIHGYFVKFTWEGRSKYIHC